jgi:DNA-directed RNA polymerase specialized sigma24 family protein
MRENMPDCQLTEFLGVVEKLHRGVPPEDEDLFQDAVLRLWSRFVAGGPCGSNIAGLLVTVTAALRIDRYRARACADRHRESTRHLGSLRSPPTPLVEAMTSEEVGLLQAAIRDLPEPTRFVLQARLQGATYAVIARELVGLGVRFPETTLHHLWRDGVRRLREHLVLRGVPRGR